MQISTFYILLLRLLGFYLNNYTSHPRVQQVAHCVVPEMIHTPPTEDFGIS